MSLFNRKVINYKLSESSINYIQKYFVNEMGLTTKIDAEVFQSIIEMAKTNVENIQYCSSPSHFEDYDNNDRYNESNKFLKELKKNRKNGIDLDYINEQLNLTDESEDLIEE